MNKFIVNSSVLLTALQYVIKATVKIGGGPVPIIENFLFTINDGTLTVSATDLQTTFKISLSSDRNQINCKPGTAFKMVVPRGIVNFLKKIEEQPITFTYDAGNYSIEVIEEDGRAKYSGDNPEDFPKSPETPIDLFVMSSDVFKEFADLLTYASKDELRPAQNGIGFVNHEGNFQMIATDGHRLQVVTVPELSQKETFNVQTMSGHVIEMSIESLKEYRAKIEEKYNHFENLRMTDEYKAHLDEINTMMTKQYFILRSKAANILAGLKFGTAKDPIVESVAVRTNEKSDAISFLFKCDNMVMEVVTSNIDERYPQYWNIIPETFTTKYTGDKAKFIKVIDKALLFAHKTTHQIRVTLNGSNKISAEDLDFSNEYSAEVGGTYEGEEIEIGFNANLLRDTVKSFGDTFVMELRAPNKPVVIREGDKLALLMPVMLNQYI